ncbi:polysaccharide deacetylase family protein, partial [Pseudomonas sp. 21615526]|nr:polysaccharide deacetylase family protein [Pseudomonas sp. 21615526]
MDDPPQQPMSFESAMKHFATVSAALALALSLSGCIGPPLALTPQTEQRLKTEALGPSSKVSKKRIGASGFMNPCRSVMADLANNPIQPGIKAVFFLQTEAPRSGGNPRGY